MYVAISIPDALSEEEFTLTFNISYKQRIIPRYPFVTKKKKNEKNNIRHRLNINPTEGLLWIIIVIEIIQPVNIKPKRENENNVSEKFI